MATPRRVILGAIIVLAAIAAYHNSFAGPFIFDDVDAIQNNATIRHLWPIWTAFSPPEGGLTVSGRPVLNFTLAVNYAIGGTKVWSYHAVNLLIHILAGLTLFGIVRRTLNRKSSMGCQPMLKDEHGLAAHATSDRATFIAFAVALIWTVHPLQTESVTYIVQRAESLMGLFYLLTLYCFIRNVEAGEESRRGDPASYLGGTQRDAASTFSGFQASDSCRGEAQRRRVAFQLFSITACLLGMATKEVMVSAPVIVLLYDRTFVSGTFREAWRSHRRLHAGLACTWLLLGGLVIADHGRGGTLGPASGISWSSFVLTQFPSVLHYLGLALKPSPLIFDYGNEWLPSAWAAIPYAVVVGMLAAGTVWALFGKTRNLRALGFAGVWFFAILAPTSLIAGGRQTMAEHRMYLALVPVIAVLVCGFYTLIRRSMGCQPMFDNEHGLAAHATSDRAASDRATSIPSVVVLAVAIIFGFLTARRNEVYQSDLNLWQDTVAKRPGNAFARTNLGAALLAMGRRAEATATLEKALQLAPFEFQAEYDLGIAMADVGRAGEAMAHYRRAIEIKPDFYKARNNLGVLLTNAGRLPEAIDQLEEAVRIKPDYAEAQIDLGLALFDSGRATEAIDRYREALLLKPDSAAACSNLGNALRQTGQLPAAVAYYRRALRLKPDYPEAHNNLGVAYAEMGRAEEAIDQYEQAVKLKPDFADAHKNLGTSLAQMNMLLGAADQFRAAVRIDPGDASAHNALGGVLFQSGRGSEAIPEYEEALRLKPDYPEALANLGVALAGAGRLPEAIQQLTRAVEIKPDDAEEHSNLAVALAASGRLSEAIFHYEAALRLRPGNADIHYNYAAALEQAGRTEEAAAQLAEAARLKGGTPR